jgi:hypothetical protein
LRDPGIYDRPFAFGTTRGDTVARGGYELQIFDADAGQDSAKDKGKDNDAHGGSGSINDLIDHGGFGKVSATDASTEAEHGKSAGDDSNRGQSQRDLHADEDGSAAAKQHAKNDPPGQDSNRGQSQRDLHADEDVSAVGKQHARHDATPENEANRGQSQRDLHAVPVNVADNQHSGSSVNAGGKDKPADHAGLMKTAATPALGDSFHFKKEVGAPHAPDVLELHVGHGPDSKEHGLHTAGHGGQDPIQQADLVGLSLAEHNGVNHAKGTEHHLTHDLIL